MTAADIRPADLADLTGMDLSSPAAASAAAGRAPIDLPAAERAVADLLTALGRDTTTEHLRDTPRRVAGAYAELLTPREFTATVFDNDAGYDGPVLVRDIPVVSLCEHHLLPFTGVAHVSYLPGEKVVGLSKLARVVEMFARDLQVQERLTAQVADWLETELAPRGVGVVIEAEHLCMSIRGVQTPGTRTTTSVVRGALRDDPALRAEFFGRTGA